MDTVQRIEESSSHLRLETMCLCVPLRLGVLLVATFTFIISFFYVADRAYFSVVYRPYTGGFTDSSKLVVGIFDFTGLLFGVVGIIGAWYCKQDYIAWFNYWQIGRLVSYLVVYWIDVPLLQTCEYWVNDIDRMTKEHGWNQTMYDIALAATCPSTRTNFFIRSVLTLLALMYVIWGTYKYSEFMSLGPKHLLRVPKDLAPGAFYAHCPGERASLNGTYGKEDYISQRIGVPVDPQGLKGMMATGGGLHPDARYGCGGPVGAPVRAGP
mmetsp:Transcript_115182/g.325452  ORF Transcript_115182/g.325452 Transcript_115182/m.325452 type:complete len:268 (+) Transcript_115182:138-941(+)